MNCFLSGIENLLFFINKFRYIIKSDSANSNEKKNN